VKCGNDVSQVSIFSNSTNQNTCKVLAGDIEKFNVFRLLNTSNPMEGIAIDMSNGQVCTQNPLTYYKTTLILRCKANLKTGDFLKTRHTNFDNISCSKTIEFDTKEACPKLNFYAIWSFLLSFKVVFGIVLIGIGLFCLTLGSKLMIITLFLTTCICVVTVIFIIFFGILIPDGASIIVVWVVLAISLIIGMLLGYFVAKYKRVVLGFLLGGYMGYIGGILLYNTAFIYIKSNPLLIYWIVILCCIALACVFAYFLFDHILILSTSFCGAYALIRGVSLLAGGFPNETYIIDMIKKEEWEELKKAVNPIVYLYLFSWILLTIFGIFFQYRIKNDEDKNKLHDTRTIDSMLNPNPLETSNSSGKDLN
jgi:hypothetical protein